MSSSSCSSLSAVAIDTAPSAARGAVGRMRRRAGAASSRVRGRQDRRNPRDHNFSAGGCSSSATSRSGLRPCASRSRSSAASASTSRSPSGDAPRARGARGMRHSRRVRTRVEQRARLRHAAGLAAQFAQRRPLRARRAAADRVGWLRPTVRASARSANCGNVSDARRLPHLRARRRAVRPPRRHARRPGAGALGTISVAPAASARETGRDSLLIVQ